MSNYASKKQLQHAAGVGTFGLAAKKDFIALKAEFGKSDNNKLANVHNSLNNLKTKTNDLDIDKLTSRQTSFEKRKIKHTKNQKI